jgi:DNA-3-methyladenine glycosylase
MGITDQFTMKGLLERTAALPREFFAREADVLARALLGTVLVHSGAAGMLVETEAYLGVDDLASHASRGITKRTQVMFGPAGYAYVYLIYGMYDCVNVVAGQPDSPHCVLVRALEPLVGLGQMAERRAWNGPATGLCNGPGKLTRALGITRAHYGADLCGEALQLRRWREPPDFAVDVTPRIGIKDNVDWPLRFTWAKHPSLSKR